MLKWQRLKNIGLVTGPGGLFATRLETESGGLATNPPCDKPIEDYSTLHRGLRQGFVTPGPRQRYVTDGGGGTAPNPYFESQPKLVLEFCNVCVVFFSRDVLLHQFPNLRPFLVLI